MIEAKRQIEIVADRFGKERWFTQGELVGVNVHTLEALKDRGFLERYEDERVDRSQYFRMKVTDDHHPETEPDYGR